MSNASIKTDLEKAVLTITLSRPQVLNSFDQEMAESLQGALSMAAAKSEIRCLLLSGEGRAFCAGQDLEQVKPRQDGSLPELGAIVAASYNPIIKAIRTLEKPVVCAVNGVAAGAGANIALACDIVLAAKSASFIQSFSKIGLIPDSGGTFSLPRLLGPLRASAWCMLGEKLSAEKAESWGLVYRVVDDSELLKEAQSLAQKLAAMPTKGLAMTKFAFNQSFENSLEEQLKLEERLQGSCGKSADYREGVAAFLEKRAPKFIGA